MNGINNNVLKIAIASLCIFILACWYFFDSGSNQPRSSIQLTENRLPPENKLRTSSRLDLQNEVNNESLGKTAETTPSEISKMILFAVVVAVPAKYSSAVILFNLSPENYEIGDNIGKTDVVLEEVMENYVTVELDGKQYTLNLIGGQAEPIADENTKVIEDKVTPLTAKEIGNRPKQLDHIISISPENNDYTVTPGVNPKLFKAAKFKPDDILQSINGKDVTDPQQLAQANDLIASAQTLKFEVLRGGKTVTLYLDIPSDDLSIKY